MSIIASTNGNNSRERIPSGNQYARIIRMYDVGSHENKHGKLQRKVKIWWELPHVTLTYKDKLTEQQVTKPRIISAMYTLSMYESAMLRKHIEQLIGRKLSAAEAQSYDVTQHLGTPCIVQVTHNGEYDNVNSMFALMQGQEQHIPAAYYDIDFFSIAQFDQDKFNKLPNGVKAKIAKSTEFGVLVQQAVAAPYVPESHNQTPPPPPVGQYQAPPPPQVPVHNQPVQKQVVPSNQQVPPPPVAADDDMPF